MNERNRMQRLVLSLDSTPSLRFSAKGSPLKVPETHGACLISNSRKWIAYADRTAGEKIGLHQRLNNHRQGKSAYVRACHRDVGDELRNGFTCRLLEVPNDRFRALLEAAAKSWL